MSYMNSPRRVIGSWNFQCRISQNYIKKVFHYFFIPPPWSLPQIKNLKKKYVLFSHILWIYLLHKVCFKLKTFLHKQANDPNLPRNILGCLSSQRSYCLVLVKIIIILIYRHFYLKPSCRSYDRQVVVYSYLYSEHTFNNIIVKALNCWRSVIGWIVSLLICD